MKWNFPRNKNTLLFATTINYSAHRAVHLAFQVKEIKGVKGCVGEERRKWRPKARGEAQKQHRKAQTEWGREGTNKEEHRPEQRSGQCSSLFVPSLPHSVCALRCCFCASLALGLPLAPCLALWESPCGFLLSVWLFSSFSLLCLVYSRFWAVFGCLCLVDGIWLWFHRIDS